MKTAHLLSLLVATSVITLSANAEMYQWKDGNGRTVISDTAPPGSAKAVKTIGGAQQSPAATPAEKTAEAAKTTAEKDMEFKKRQQEGKEKAEKDAKEQAANAEKKENCERARRNLTALESSQPVAQLDENGQPKLMDNSQREQEMERARKMVADSCK
ncbi:MAG: DUF4124 domain-containing protein [Azonexus sp.]